MKFSFSCKTLLIGVLLQAGIACAAEPIKSDYPIRPITMVVGYVTGGFTDLFARVVSDELGARLGQRVIVENKPGAGGTIAGAFVARSAPDGYTLLIASPPHVISPLLQDKQPYAPANDFRSTGLLASTPSVLVASPSAPFNTLQELIAYGKANPGKLNYASGSIGATSHLSLELLKIEAGLDILHVPYKGSAPVALDLLAGRIDLAIDNVLFYSPYIKDGRVKPIAAVGRQRSSLLPNVETFTELGYPAIEAQAWYMVLAPTGTPQAIVDRLNKELLLVMQKPSIQARMAGADFLSGTPKDGDALLRSELQKWGKVVRQAKIKAE